jgi:hypothetical protein
MLNISIFILFYICSCVIPRVLYLTGAVAWGEAGTGLGRFRRKWEDNIIMDFRQLGWGGMNWIDLAQDRDR